MKTDTLIRIKVVFNIEDGFIESVDRDGASGYILREIARWAMEEAEHVEGKRFGRLAPRFCECCKAPLIDKRADAIYCSMACRRDAFRDRRRQEELREFATAYKRMKAKG